MQLGMVGLGRMGSNMVRRLIPGGRQCVVFDPYEPGSWGPKEVETVTPPGGWQAPVLKP
jgi:6-phosphogluconate dehydrogenase (decarboxylating)